MYGVRWARSLDCCPKKHTKSKEKHGDEKSSRPFVCQWIYIHYSYECVSVIEIKEATPFLLIYFSKETNKIMFCLVWFGLAYIQRYRNEVIMPRILNLLHNKVWHPHYFHFYTAVIYGQTLLTKSN